VAYHIFGNSAPADASNWHTRRRGWRTAYVFF
jgi:hypothetical protein